MPQINPDILRWARETAGLTREDAARKLAIRDTKTAMAVDRLRAMEDGERPPTRPMLSRMAKQYHRPLVAFYLSQPPRRANWGRDFRAPSTDRSARDEAVLDALVRNVQARQGLLRSAMLDDDDDLAPLRFLGSATIDTPVARVVAAIRDTLGLQPVEFRAASNPDEAFRLLRSHAERAGIFVLLLGNLGSYHTDLDVEVFRGFALLDDFAPFVVVNPKDSAGARSFTLLHELAHLWLREPGVSAGDPTDPVEVYCNRVASSFLLPHNELAGKKHERQLLAERDSGPTYDVLVRHSLGSRLIDLTFRLEASGSLTATKVGRVLGVNPRNAHTEAWAASEADGRPPRLAQVGLPGQPVTDADRSAYVDSIVEDRPELRREAEEVAALMPDTKPILATIFVDDEHRLWVQRVTPEGAPAFYDLFSADGDYLGSVRLGFVAAGPLVIRRSTIYTWIEDDLEVPYVVRAPLSWGRSEITIPEGAMTRRR